MSKARYDYSCATCGSGVKKEPLVNQQNWQKMSEGKDYKGLGGWRCSGGCQGHIKVKRVLL